MIVPGSASARSALGALGALAAALTASCAQRGVAPDCFDTRPQGQISYSTHGPQQIRAALGSAPSANAERAAKLREMFAAAGCSGDRLREQRMPESDAPNLVCSLPGTGQDVIVVGAHLDKVPHGDGVVDNWSGASLLPALYADLGALPRLHRFVLVAFSAEEEGLIGSRAFVRDLAAEERARIRAMVNLDVIGLGPTKVELSRSDPDLVCRLLMAGSATRQSIAAVNADGVGTSDWEPFKQAGIPIISIHSLTRRTLPILHTERDKLEALDLAEHYRSYQLISAYLAILDQSLAQR